MTEGPAMRRGEQVRQLIAIVRLELRKGFLGRRAVPLYLLAGLPVALTAILSYVGPRFELWGGGAAQLKGIYANLYQAFILRQVVFFGCVWIFMNLIRGEVVDRVLHFYLLVPVRREVLLAGKYLAGLVVSVVLFAGCTAASFVFLFARHGIGEALGMGELLGYCGVTALGCLGYGSIFLALGIFFRNPVVPAVVLFGWEWANFLLPPLLKKLSVVHYLKWMSPVPVAEGLFALQGDPVSVPGAVAGLLLFSTALLAIAALAIRRLEIQYGSD